MPHRKLRIIFWSVISLIVILIGVFIIYFVTVSKRVDVPTGGSQLVGHIVLSKEYVNGSLADAGVSIPYDVTGTYPNTSLILLSPDKSKVVYTVWENAHIVIYVAKTDGTGKKKIAEQKVPEGSGILDVNSIRWSEDGMYITYAEDGSRCLKANCINPEDFSLVRTVQSIYVSTGEQSVVIANDGNSQTAIVPKQTVEYPILKTYTSEKLGFSFQYPVSYYLTELGNAVGLSGGESEMWEYNISANPTEFKTINDWLAAQPKGGAASGGVQPVLRIGDDAFLVDDYEIVDYNGNKPIYGKHLEAITVRDGKIFKIAIRSQLHPQDVSWITLEAMAIVVSLK
jgi:hypothetical protein